MSNYIPYYNIEKKYGGGADDLIFYWPPIVSEEQDPPLTQNQFLLKGIKLFCYFDQKDSKVFRPENIERQHSGQVSKGHSVISPPRNVLEY